MWTDPHAPHHDRPAVRCLDRAIGIIKPDVVNCLGDLGEWEPASHWQWKKKKRPPLDYQLAEIDKDIEAVNLFLDERDAVCAKAGVKTKRMLQGNHDDWIDRVVYENPHISRTRHKWGRGYLFQDALNLRGRGYKFSPLGEYVKVGKLYLHHGHHYSGIHHTINHLRQLGRNIMYGHHHDVQHRVVTQLEGPIGGWSIGCLKCHDHEANEWLGRRKHNWGHAFAVVDFISGGEFRVHVVDIVGGRCSLWGELIDGNKA